MVTNRMENEQMSISGYAQTYNFTCIGVDFADSKIVVYNRNLLHQHCANGEFK